MGGCITSADHRIDIKSDAQARDGVAAIDLASSIVDGLSIAMDTLITGVLRNDSVVGTISSVTRVI